MTSGEPPAGPSATKLGGFALIGVGALAAVFGVATVVSGEPSSVARGTGGTPAPGPESSAVSNPPPGAGTPAGSGKPSATTSRPQSPSSSAPENRPSQPAEKPPQRPESPGAQPSAGAAPAPGVPDQAGRPGQAGQDGQAGQSTNQRIKLRVYNNSKIRGLAHRAADDFRRAGYRVIEIGNYSGGRIPVTTVYYRPGTPEKAQAEVVAQRFGARLKPRFPGIAGASPGVIAIVTKNYDGPEQGK